MPDIVIQSGGVTDDQTPEVRIVLNTPLWEDAELHITRNGVDVGVATKLSSTEFVFVDNVTDGTFEYRAVVSRQNVSKRSAPYFVQVSTPVVVDPAPVIESVINDDEDQSLPTPVITGVIGEPIPVPQAAQDGALLMLGSEEPVVLGSGIHWRRVVLSTAVTSLQIDTAQGAADTVIGLFSVAGSLIATDAESGGNLPGGTSYTSVITMPALAAGTYYLAITGYAAAFSDSFTVQQLGNPPNDYAEEFILRMSYTPGGA